MRRLGLAQRGSTGPVRTPRSAKCEVVEGDCVAGMTERLSPTSVDVIVTSPPYNIGKEYNEYDDTRADDAYLRWMEGVAEAVETVLSDRGSFFLNLGSKPSRPAWPFEVLESFRGRFKLQNTILWVKSIVIDGSDDGREAAAIHGHYKPVNSHRFLSGMAEYVFHLTKHGDVPLAKLSVGTPYKDKSNVTRWRDEATDLRDRGNVWFIPYDTIHSSRPHPCVFPPKLPRMCILLHGIETTRLVLDPFVGTGSTGVACTELGIPFVGFDIDPYYVGLARRAISQANSSAEDLNSPGESQTRLGIDQ